ncbi:class I SAM-dependent methyltransferase [Methylobacterium sp. Leaf118]|uniref:class I SAM-dependent methyltransferase n=1 Tax=Methylobacterium sp. Leaf118 TaxID=2876562 RepID=UPI001E63E3C5|nr:methyltransferase domain-containing protein [Methylobacterium sp. Leaf118]
MNARVLDVGAGPATVLGRTHPKRNIDLVACDPLAPVYNTLLDRHGVTPPIRTVQAFAEDLSSVFDAESFDIVYCQNALDHSFEPLRGIEEMLIVLRTRGVIVMAHYTDEAEHERYVGLHQWNFNARDGRFIIWNRVQEIDVNEALKDVARVTVTVEGRGHAVTIEKLRDWPNSLHERHRNRLASLLSGLLDAEGVTKAADQELKRINAMANPADGEHRDEALKPAQHSP